MWVAPSDELGCWAEGKRQGAKPVSVMVDILTVDARRPAAPIPASLTSPSRWTRNTLFVLEWPLLGVWLQKQDE